MRNHGPHFIQAPHKPMPPSYQQLPAAPPPHFQTVLPPPTLPPPPSLPLPPSHPLRPSLLPPSTLPPPPSHVYQHGPHVARNVIPQAPLMQLPAQGITNISQSHFHMQPPIHGSTSFSPSYLNAKQNSLAPSQSVGHIVHNVPRPGPSFIGNPPTGLIRSAPFKVLPPHPTSQMETMYRAPLHMVALHGHGGIQALQNLPLPPHLPQPPANFSFSAPITSSDLMIMPTPPLPSSPPPLPPSPPPSIPLPSSFSVPSVSVSNKPCLSILDPGSPILGNSMKTLDSIDEAVSPNEVRHNAHRGNFHLNQKGQSGTVPVGSMMVDKFSSDISVMLDLPSPPSNPTEQNIVKMESLCQNVIKDCPDIENISRRNECENPDNYSFVDEPGNVDAMTHEFSLRTSQVGSTQVNGLIVSAGNSSPADADMEMEDPLQGSHSPSKCSGANGFSYENVSCSSFASLGKREDEEADNANKSTQQIKDSSPFRLIQSYASDDDSENEVELCNGETSPEAMLPIVAASARSSKLTMNNFADMKSKTSSRDVEEFDPLSESSLSDKPSGWREANKTGEASGIRFDEGEHQTSVYDDVSEAVPDKESLNISGGNIVYKREKSGKDKEEKKAKLETAPLKIDEFGRLVREGCSDSDSDDSSYMRRHYKRARSRSRSHSPADRRRNWRSPRRRRDRRSRSPSSSWSPRIQRSKNRSPFRRGREFFSKTRRERGQIPVCFDFNKGRCYRGASCHYMHNESSKNTGSRRHWTKQQYTDIHPSIKSKMTVENENFSAEPEVLDLDHNEVKSRRELLSHDFPSKDGDNDGKNQEYVTGGAELNLCDDNNGLSDPNLSRRQSSREGGIIEEAPAGQEKQVSPHVSLDRVEPAPPLPGKGISDQPILNFDAEKPHGDASQDMLPLPTSPENFPSKSTSVAELENPYCSYQRVDGSSDSVDERPMTSPKRFSKSGAFPDKISPLQPPYSTMNELSSPAIEFSHSPPQLPPPPPLSRPQGVSAINVSWPQMDYISMPQATSFPHQFTATENFGHPQISSSNQHSQTSGLPSSSWIWPLPHQPLYDSAPIGGTSNYGTSFPFQNAFPTMQEPRRPFSNMGDIPGKPPGCSYPPSQSFGDLSIKREHFMQNSEALDSLSLLTHRSSNPECVPPSQELSVNKMQYSFDENIRSDEFWKSSSQMRPNSQFQQPRFSLQVSAGGTASGLAEKTGSVSLPFPKPLSDFVGPRFPPHYNPYAFTFEQPLPINFDTSVWKQRNDTPKSMKSSTDFCLNVQVGEQGFGSFGSKQTTAPPYSTTDIGLVQHKSGTDQYDPLFDSIEPSSSLRKSNLVQKREQTGDSDIIMQSRVSHKPLDFEKNKEAGPDASSTSRNDEFGETADAEVGVVDNQSESHTNGEANLTGGEIEVDQAKSSEKKKKRKSSRSNRLFKISIANFVKEVLKPSWRQGNMSEEAFKTIVKKSVDKVSGAMKSHHIPKSQEKINRYIDSSQRKLTKLVMGYVHKYVRS